MPQKTTTKPSAGPANKSKRLAPEVRKAQILDSAARLVVEQGYLPLPIEQLARAAGTSKALVYAYYPTQYALFNALLDRELRSLALAGLDTASRVDDLEQATVLCAMMYFEHVARSGPLLHILMTDLYMAGHIEPALAAALDEFVARLTGLAAKSLPLSEQEIYAAMEMVAAIPEESGRLVFHAELDHATARQICHELTASSLKALRAPEQVSVPD
jgi:AcrR family transcriptional regulator